MTRLSMSKDRIRVLLLEGLHENARLALSAAGYTSVDLVSGALQPDELRRRIADVHMIGIRSGSKLDAPTLAAARKLFCIGCFCIGTNQVDLDAARRAGIPVFNAPYSSTRSVAELVLGEIIMLLRGVHQRSLMAHRGVWVKTSAGSHEIRGRMLGIVGYGHIGSQLSILAEGLGMRVCYYDIVDKLSIGNAQRCRSLGDLIQQSDVVSLHVPGTPETAGMIRNAELRAMRHGACLINASRGSVVDLDALAEVLKEGHLAGAAVDVFPVEPSSKDGDLQTPLRGLDNVILTPHIGGSTAEAQASIGSEVAEKLVRYSDTGSTLGAVNFVEVMLPVQAGATRFLHVHRDEPGLLSRINDVFSRRGHNIAGQYLRTDGAIGYVVVDVDGPVDDDHEVRKELRAIPGTIRVRFLY